MSDVTTIRVRLRKVTSTHNNLRTDVIDGFTSTMPEIGRPFVIYNYEPLDLDEGARYVITSPVVAVEGSTFRTMNSTYALEVLDVVEGE